MSDFTYHKMFPLAHAEMPWRKITGDYVETARFGERRRAQGRWPRADRTCARGLLRRFPPAAPGPPRPAAQDLRRPRGLRQRPLRRLRALEERQHRRGRRATHVPGHRHRHRHGQARPPRVHRRRRRGAARGGHRAHLRREQPALFPDGAAHHVRRGQHRHQPAGPDRPVRRRGRRVRIPVRGQGRRLGQQDLPLPGDQGAPEPGLADEVRRREDPHAGHRRLPALPPRHRHRRHLGGAHPQDRQARVVPLPRRAARRRATSTARRSATSSSSGKSTSSPRTPASAPSSAASTSATTCA